MTDNIEAKKDAATEAEKKPKKTALPEYIIIALLLLAAGFGVFALISRLGEAKEAELVADSKLVLYEGPKSLRDATDADLKSTSERSRDFSLLHCTDTTITVNGQDCFVYDTNVNNSREWNEYYQPSIARTPVAYFDFEGTVKISVTVPNIDIESVKLSPHYCDATLDIDKGAHTVSFFVSEPDAYTLTFNGVASRAVHIFANPLETDIPDFDDENVIYVGPGEWNIDSIIPESGQTVYISGGAVIHGVINANYAENVTVMGRGIIDGSHLSTWAGRVAYIPLKFDHCSNVTIKDVIVLNSNAWNCQGYDSHNGVIDGLKIISCRPNSDGITLQSCTNYEVKNCFVRSWDDSLVVKNYSGNSHDLSLKHMQLWTDLAQSMEVGYETNKGSKPNAFIKDIVFEDITVLNNFHKPVISVHNADDATVSDIVFRDIVVENSQVGGGDGSAMPYLIDINIDMGSWATTKERGNIRDILIENVTVLDGKFNESRISGYDSEHTVSGVIIRNLTILGQKITDFETGKFKIEKYTDNLTIE